MFSFSLIVKRRYSFLPLKTVTKTKIVDSWVPHLRSTRYKRELTNGLSLIYWFGITTYDTVRFFTAGELHRLHGPASTYYYENGNVEEEVWFVRGKLISTYRYDFNGKLIMCTFTKKKEDGLVNYCISFSLERTCWYKNGCLFYME
jgi:antitoxin component YwqK of YwqJK toxin-antitoxin module